MIKSTLAEFAAREWKGDYSVDVAEAGGRGQLLPHETAEIEPECLLVVVFDTVNEGAGDGLLAEVEGAGGVLKMEPPAKEVFYGIVWEWGELGMGKIGSTLEADKMGTGELIAAAAGAGMGDKEEEQVFKTGRNVFHWGRFGEEDTVGMMKIKVEVGLMGFIVEIHSFDQEEE